MSLKNLKDKKEKLIRKRDLMNEEIKKLTFDIERGELVEIKNVLLSKNMNLEQAKAFLMKSQMMEDEKNEDKEKTSISSN